MAENEVRRRILDMLAAGTISVDEAANLLKALGAGTPGRAIEPPAPPRPAGQARLLRISIDAVKPEDEPQSVATKQEKEAAATDKSDDGPAA